MKTKPIPPASGGQSVRALLGSGKTRRNSRKSLVGIFLGGALLIFLRALVACSNCLGAILAALVRTVGPPLARAGAFLAVFGAVTVATVHYGTKLTHWSLSRAAVAADSAYQRVGEARTLVASLLPRFAEEEDDAPRAELVTLVHPASDGALVSPVAPAPEAGEFARPPGGFLDSVRGAIGEVASLLPDIGVAGAAYPAPPGLPRIEGDVLEKAGGDRIQALITRVLDTVHQVEAGGKLYCEGDEVKKKNGEGTGVYLAFGPLQVRREPCVDLEERFGAAVDHRACDGDWLLSEYVFRLYVGYWAAHVEKTEGRSVTGEDLLRIWNGGPDMGPTSATDRYIAKAVKFDREVVKIAAVAK